ncbi:MAG: GNAT family N-acetyltransferase [Oligosphaeraceae bacterium]
MSQLTLRPERPEQVTDMEALVRDAFWDRYMPGCDEPLIVHRLRHHPDACPPLCLAAEHDGQLAGGIWYAKAAIRTPDGGSTPLLTFGPVAVRPDLQRQGIGGALIRETLERARQTTDFPGVVIYGSPDYYTRFGFRPAADFGITDAEGNDCPALLALPFADDALPAGAFLEGDVYHVSSADARAFDRQFPHRQAHLRSPQLCLTPFEPPSDDPLVAESQTLRREAEVLLRTHGILELWESLGARIRLVGSMRTGLMMGHRDIDLHLYTDTLDPRRTLDALAPLIAHPSTVKLTYRNLADTDEHCLEWHLFLKDDHGHTWQLDMIQILAGSRLDGFFEDIADAILDALTPDTRRAILALKRDARDAQSHDPGIVYCMAVLGANVRTPQQFRDWRTTVSPDDLIAWRP